MVHHIIENYQGVNGCGNIGGAYDDMNCKFHQGAEDQRVITI